MKKTIVVNLIKYRLDTRDNEESKQYETVQKLAKKQGHKLMDCISSDGARFVEKLENGTYEIDTNHLFGDQYNTAENSGNLRLHDWYEAIVPARYLKIGYYLELSPELMEVKQNRFICGYCGAQYDNPEIHFCSKCTGSEHLTVDELHLLLLVRINESFGADRKKLASELPEDLKAQWEVEQEKTKQKIKQGKIDRETKDAHKLITDAGEKMKQAIYERDFRLHCIGAGLAECLSNMIYYPHTNTFCFGWRDSIKDTSEQVEIERATREYTNVEFK